MLFVSRAYDKASEAHEKATLALAQIEKHEEECANRYRAIVEMLKDNTKSLDKQYYTLISVLLSIGGAILLGLITLVVHLLEARGIL